MTAHYVYRIFGQDGRLLYVGCTKNLTQRLRLHSQGWWGNQATKAVAKVYRDRSVALAAERQAIADEEPRWNLVGAFRHHRSWTRHQFIDYVTATRNQPVITDYTRTHLANVARLYEARFGVPLAAITTEYSAEEVA